MRRTGYTTYLGDYKPSIKEVFESIDAYAKIFTEKLDETVYPLTNPIDGTHLSVRFIYNKIGPEGIRYYIKPLYSI